eukprot:gene5435-9248_t
MKRKRKEETEEEVENVSEEDEETESESEENDKRSKKKKKVESVDPLKKLIDFVKTNNIEVSKTIQQFEPKILETLKIQNENKKRKIQIDGESFEIETYGIKKINESLIIINFDTPVYSIDWSFNFNEQYICVAPYNKNEYHLSKKQYSGKGKYYIYSFNENKIELKIRAIIHHEHGIINELKWMNKKNFENKKQIGIIGISFSDGTLGVYMIPKEEKNINLKIEGFENMNKFESSCTCLEWINEGLISGYSNGDIIIWKFNQNYELKTNNSFLIPIRQFKSHSTSIKSISKCNINSNIFVTCGYDNKLKFWNLNEISQGIIIYSLLTHSWISNICWGKRVNSLFSTSHDGNICQLEIVESDSRMKTIVNDQSPINDISMSSTNSCFAFGCLNGNVKLKIFKKENCYESKPKDDTIKILNINENVEIKTKSFKKDKKNIVFDEKQWINKLKFNPSTNLELRNWLLIATNSGLVILKKIK